MLGGEASHEALALEGASDSKDQGANAEEQVVGARELGGNLEQCEKYRSAINDEACCSRDLCECAHAIEARP